MSLRRWSCTGSAADLSISGHSILSVRPHEDGNLDDVDVSPEFDAVLRYVEAAAWVRKVQHGMPYSAIAALSCSLISIPWWPMVITSSTIRSPSTSRMTDSET